MERIVRNGTSQSVFTRLTNINSAPKQELLQCTARWFSTEYPSLQTALATVGAVLRCADEHFDEVVMQGVVKLALEAPFELGVVEVAGMEIEVIGVDRDRGVLELDHYFDAFTFGTRGKVQQGMLVETELAQDSVEAGDRGFGHRGIVKQVRSERIQDASRQAAGLFRYTRK